MIGRYTIRRYSLAFELCTSIDQTVFCSLRPCLGIYFTLRSMCTTSNKRSESISQSERVNEFQFRRDSACHFDVFYLSAYHFFYIITSFYRWCLAPDQSPFM